MSTQLNDSIQYYEIGKLKLACRIILAPGADKTIVFLHDSLGSISIWRDFPQKLCQIVNANAIIYDRQGHGLSCGFTSERRPDYLFEETRILSELLQAIESKRETKTNNSVDRYILFGHSDGGTIAILTAALHADKVQAIVTEGAHVFNEEITLAGIRDAVALYQSTDLKQRLQKYHGNKTEQLFANWVGIWQSPQFRDFNIEHLLPFIVCPVLAIQGSLDEYGSAAQLDSIISQVDSQIAKKGLIDGAAHTPHKERMKETLQVVAKFVQRICLD